MKAMELLSDKLSDIPGSSAIIVSHDMHLAVSFADLIIKVRKKGEHGYIDERSAFSFDSENGKWTNGEYCYDSIEFESFLRKRI